MALILTVDAWWQPCETGLRLRRRGDTLDVDGEVAQWLQANGFAADESEVEKAKEIPAEPPAEVQEPEKPAEKPAGNAKRPKNAAPVDDWRAFAKSKGIDTAGLSKGQIIAATR